MGENEISLIVGEMRAGFQTVRDDIRASRNERQAQIAAVHQRINTIAEGGCAHRLEHERKLAELAQMVAKQGIDESSIFGSFQTRKWKATGMAAAVVAIGIAYAIAKSCNWL